MHSSPTMNSFCCLPKATPSASSAISKRKHTSCNLDVKLDVICHKQRGKHGIDIACAVQIPETTIILFFKSEREIETKALNLLKDSKVKITHQKVM
jgi:hypothetical protein